MELEGEKPTPFFCKMNKKRLAKALFEELHVEEVDENGKESVKIIREQNSIEWEVWKYYYNLNSKQEARIDKEEILQNTDVLTKIDLEDVKKLVSEITEGEMSVTLNNTRKKWPLDRMDLVGLFIIFLEIF